MVQLLIDHGANVYAANKEGELPIHYAAQENYADLIVQLTKGGNKRRILYGLDVNRYFDTTYQEVLTLTLCVCFY